jgi:peptidoglycan/LPS O-acetylase OafA/YrhL
MRLARILPAHYVVLAIILLFFTFKAFVSHNPAAINEPGDMVHLFYNILNIQAWGVTNSLQWNHPAWSISAEWFAYLLFPFLAFQTAKLKNAWSNLVVIVLCFAALFCTMQVFQMPTLNFLPAYSLYRVLFEFIIGCSLYNIYKSTGTLKLGWLSILSVLGILAGSFYYVHDLYLFACIVCLLFSLAHGKGMIANVLSIKPAVYLGEISYSVYLVHDFLISRLKGFENSLDFFDKGLGLNLLVLALYLVILAISASGLYHYVEVPARNFIKTFSSFRKTVPG